MLSLEYLRGMSLWQVLFREPIYFTGGLLIVNVERYVYVFSLRPFLFWRKEFFNFLHGRNSLAIGLLEAGRDMGAPKIHM